VRARAVAALASSLVLLGACGDGDTSATDPSPAPASTPPEAGPSGSDDTAGPPDPCSLLTEREAARVLGSRRSSERIEGDGITAGTVTCRFASGRDPEDPALDVIVSDAAGADFDDLLRAYGAVPGTDEEDLEVPGTDGAALLVEDDEALATATALVLDDDVVHVVVGSAGEVGEARRVARGGVDAVFRD